MNNADLYQAMVKFKKDYEAAKLEGKRPEIDNFIGLCFMTIAQRLSNKSCYIGYSFKEEMIADGYENCIQYMHNFDPDKYTNAFAYFTQIINNAFLRRIMKERKQQYVKLKATQDVFVLETDMLGDRSLSHDALSGRQLYENNQAFIQDFETALTKKRKAGKQVGLEKFTE